MSERREVEDILVVLLGDRGKNQRRGREVNVFFLSLTFCEEVKKGLRAKRKNTFWNN